MIIEETVKLLLVLVILALITKLFTFFIDSYKRYDETTKEIR
jgi:hypothetical protein